MDTAYVTIFFSGVSQRSSNQSLQFQIKMLRSRFLLPLAISFMEKTHTHPDADILSSIQSKAVHKWWLLLLKSSQRPNSRPYLLLLIVPFLFLLYLQLLPPSMANPNPERRNSNTQVLEELEALSQSLYQTHTARRTASLVLPRSAAVEISDASAGAKPEAKLRLRRLSLSPWRSRPETQKPDDRAVPQKPAGKKFDTSSATEKKGIWNWKPIRALSHMGMHRMSCLFSVEVVAVQGLPSSMNGLRLAVCVRKKETKEGAVQTMPARVLQGAADFEETLFIKCHVYCSGGGAEKAIKFDPKPFLIFVKAVDAEELDFGRSLVDLSALVQESMEKNLEGTRIRQWDTSFDLIGKAKGSELVLKLGFQIIEDKGVGIYRQEESLKSSKTKDSSSSSYAWKQSKTSFSVTSPRITSRSSEAHIPSKSGRSTDLQGIDDLNLNEPSPALVSSSSVDQKSEQQAKAEELELPEFDVVDKGVEFQEGEEGKTNVDWDAEPKEAIDEQFISSEVVKEVVLDQGHQRRLTELDSIAKQIKALESMIQIDNLVKNEQETEVQCLDAEEETVTREFLQMLEEEDIIDQFKLTLPEISPFKLEGAEEVIARGSESESKVFVPDLGKGIGSVVQTRDGGYLASMNPLNIEVPRKETPKLAMQISKPLLLSTTDSGSGFELFQKLAGIGTEELSSRILSLAAMDDLTGKTAEQVAFEGIASAIIHGRNKEVASSSAARSIAAVRGMVAALSAGRKERLNTGIWNVSENQVPLDEILSFSLQKIESTVLEGLKIQADMSDGDPPFDVSPAAGPPVSLDSVRPFYDWLKDGANAPESVTMMVVIQLRDPPRRYEAVGGPMVVIVQAARVEGEMVKVGSLSVGGAKGRHVRDGERQRLTAMQWLVAYGLGKAGKKGKHVQRKGGEAPALWSVSARVMADLWLKPIRNPDVRLAK